MKAIIISLGLLVSLSTDAQNTVIVANDQNTSSSYVQDGRHIRVTHYHTNGVVRETGTFLNNVPDGKWETFAENGTKTAELNYRDGKRHGEFRVWDTFSDSYIEMQYADGEVLAANRYVKEAGFASTEK
jgi:antitoxin component YwqK of YwqJK toxin-antitoxin module